MGEIRVQLRCLSSAAEEQLGVNLDAIDLDVRSGEIVGIAGVAGNGQTELMSALIGERLAEHAEAILINGVEAGLKGPNPRRALGTCFLPEERLGNGTRPGRSLTEKPPRS